jgi:hypothetical protein
MTTNTPYSNTITVTAQRVLISYPNGSRVALPAQVPGVAMSTVDALKNVLQWYSVNDIRDYVSECLTEAEDVNATPAQVAYHVVAWMAGAGDWAE